jgi:hypothetical protein
MDNSINETFMYVRAYADGVNLSVEWFKGFCELIQSGWHRHYEWLGETYNFDSLKDFIGHEDGLKTDPLAIYLTVESCSKNSKFDPYAKELLDLFTQENFNPVPESIEPINKPGRPSTITPEDKMKIQQMRLDGMTQQQIANEIGVAQSTIHSIGKDYNIIISDKDTKEAQKSKTQGTSQGYLLGRIKRDFPGEELNIGKGKKYKSARAAAIELGIIKDKAMIALPGEPEVLANNLKSKCDVDYLNEMAESLGYIVPSVNTGGDIASKLYQTLSDKQLRDLYTNLCDYLAQEF